MTYLDPIVTGLVAGIRRIERGSLLLRGLCADVACGRRQERGPVAIRILRAPRLPATVGSRGIFPFLRTTVPGNRGGGRGDGDADVGGGLEFAVREGEAGDE